MSTRTIDQLAVDVADAIAQWEMSRRVGYTVNIALWQQVKDAVIEQADGFAGTTDPPLTDHIEVLARALWTGCKRAHVSTEYDADGYIAYVTGYGREGWNAESPVSSDSGHAALLALREELRRRVAAQAEAAQKELEVTR